jgi:signal transduction histidine kinase
LAINLNLKKMHAAEADPQRREAMAELVRETGKIVDEIRRVALSLRPAVAEKLGLAGAIRWLVDAETQNSGLQIDVRARVDHEPGGEATDHLCRILQEALTNVPKHAAATQVRVTVTAGERWLSLTVADNGKGFDSLEQEKDAHGLGLITMRERAELLGGRVTVSSTPGTGTTVTVVL